MNLLNNFWGNMQCQILTILLSFFFFFFFFFFFYFLFFFFRGKLKANLSGCSLMKIEEFDDFKEILLGFLLFYFILFYFIFDLLSKVFF